MGRVRARGIEVVLCTGRRFRTALPIAKELGLAGAIVVSNGGLVKEIESARTRHQSALPGEASADKDLALFDGKNFAHWDMTEEGGWAIESDGSMVCLMKEIERKGKKRTVGRGYLWTKKHFLCYAQRTNKLLSFFPNTSWIPRIGFMRSWINYVTEAG